MLGIIDYLWNYNMKSFIQDTCLKTPTIMKMFLRFYDNGDDIDQNLIVSLNNIILNNKSKLARVGINYAQIKNLDNLIESIELLLKIKVDIRKSKQKIIKELKDDGIEFNINSSDIQFEVTSYEMMKKYGSNTWCIVHNIRYFNHYKGKDRKIFIIFKFENDLLQDTLGITVKSDSTIYSACNNRNQHIAPENYSLNIKKISKYKVPFNDKKNHVRDDKINKESETFDFIYYLLFSMPWTIEFYLSVRVSDTETPIIIAIMASFFMGIIFSFFTVRIASFLYEIITFYDSNGWGYLKFRMIIYSYISFHVIILALALYAK